MGGFSPVIHRASTSCRERRSRQSVAETVSLVKRLRSPEEPSERMSPVDTRETRPHTGRRRNEAVRRAILDAALDLLSDADGAPVTVETIARAAGVGKQT